jgi:hypothetical protein
MMHFGVQNNDMQMKSSGTKSNSIYYLYLKYPFEFHKMRTYQIRNQCYKMNENDE